MDGPVGPNPYVAPVASVAGGPLVPWAEGEEAEVVRLRYLGPETSVKTVGSLLVLWAILWGFTLVFLVTRALPGGPVEVAVSAVVMSGGFVLGVGLMRLRRWARRATAFVLVLGFVTLLALLGLIVNRGVAAFGEAGPGAFGAAVGGACALGLVFLYALSLLHSSKARAVCSPEYLAVVAATPRIRSRSGCLLKGCLAVLAIWLLRTLLTGAFRSLTR